MELSILIPACNEIFLARTIQDILEHLEADTEILVGLDGAWADPVIPDHPRVKILHVSESIGQRAMTNQLARLSKARYLAKVDAHCSFDQGFDRKMLEFFKEVGDDVVAVPVMKNLCAFDWVCPEAKPRVSFNARNEPHRRYQSPSGPCKDCGQPTTRDITWMPRERSDSTSYCFDSTPHFQYFKEYRNKPEYQQMKEKGYTESMSLQGSFFMCSRHRYWSWEANDERMGNWGNQGLEVACAFWLSGGRVLVNHKTWYAHMFRTQGGDFGFPWKAKDKDINKTKDTVKDKFWNKKHPKQIYPVSWLVEKFKPVPGWDLKNIS